MGKSARPRFAEKFRHWGVSPVGLWRSPNRRTGWAPLWNAHVRFSRTPVCMVDGRVHADTFGRRRAATRAGKACERERMVASDVGVFAMENFPLAACATWAAAGRAICDIRGLGWMTRYPAGKMAALGRAARTGPIDFPSRKLFGQPARITLGAFCDSRTAPFPWAGPARGQMHVGPRSRGGPGGDQARKEGTRGSLGRHSSFPLSWRCQKPQLGISWPFALRGIPFDHNRW